MLPCSGFGTARGCALGSSVRAEVASRRPSVAALGTRRDPPPGRREYDIGKFVERRAYNICASLLCYLFSDSVFKKRYNRITVVRTCGQ